MGLLRVLLLGSYKWDWIGLDLCVGLLYEHRLAVLISISVFDQIRRNRLQEIKLDTNSDSKLKVVVSYAEMRPDGQPGPNLGFYQSRNPTCLSPPLFLAPSLNIHSR